MSVFNRSFVSLLALAWCAAMAAGAYLIWDQSRDIHLSTSNINLNFDLIFTSQAEQILATIVIAALALPALMLLAMEITPSGSRAPRYDRRRDESYGGLQAKVDLMQKQLDEERNRRRDVEKDYGRERGLVTDEARRNANVVRDSASQAPVIVKDDTRRDSTVVRETAAQPAVVETKAPVTSSRRGWHLLPRRS